MIERNFILATAGHVDHGKSSLVKALTGIDPDRLPEEKARGITIDLGFAHLDLKTETAHFNVGIVDVPGHEDFVKNMVAGVGSIDLALLIVAADDGWMPQTEEHLQILTYLGVTRAVVALTKIDLATNESAPRESIRESLRNSPFADAPIVATSTITGRGIEELKTALAQEFATIPAPRDIAKPRLPIDRVFMLRGIGAVVTGTLTGGKLRQGQSVVIQPRGVPARIRSVQRHSKEVAEAVPGTRTALNIVDADALQRGEVITLPDLGSATSIFDALLERSNRTPARPLKDGTRVRIHLGSGNVPARLLLDTRKPLEPGAHAFAQFRCEQPIFAFAGDRFIVRDWSEQLTLAGGIITAPHGERGAITTADGSLTSIIAAEVARSGARPAEGLLVQSRFGSEEISTAISTLVAESKLRLHERWLIDAAWWNQQLDAAAKRIDDFHRAHPDRSGLEITDLKTSLAKPDLFEFLLTSLRSSGFVQSGATIRRATHQLALPPNLQAAAAAVRKILAAKPFDPPSRKDIAPDARTEQALRFLIQSGEVTAITEDVVLSTDAFSRAVDQIKAFLSSHGAATASELRQHLATSRRVLIPLLEKLDAVGVTRREGDNRVLRR